MEMKTKSKSMNELSRRCRRIHYRNQLKKLNEISPHEIKTKKKKHFLKNEKEIPKSLIDSLKAPLISLMAGSETHSRLISLNNL